MEFFKDTWFAQHHAASPLSKPAWSPHIIQSFGHWSQLQSHNIPQHWAHLAGETATTVCKPPESVQLRAERLDLPDITTIQTADYQQYGCRLNENTSSSPSGLHHGYDKAAAQCNELSDFFAFQMTTIVCTGLRPAQWGVALQIMLEKIAGMCLVDKLRSIHLVYKLRCCDGCSGELWMPS